MLSHSNYNLNSNFNSNSKLNSKFNRFFLSLQQIECFLNTICTVNRSKKIWQWVRKF